MKHDATNTMKDRACCLKYKTEKTNEPSLSEARNCTYKNTYMDNGVSLKTAQKVLIQSRLIKVLKKVLSQAAIIEQYGLYPSQKKKKSSEKL